jgi:putative phage-type endonuclease
LTTATRTAPVELVPASADRGEWLAARRDGIGASEIAAVLGISPWDSPFSLYWKKREGWESEVNDDMRTGILVEPVVAEWWLANCDPNENLTLSQVGLFASGERPWQICTPDRLVHLACPSCGDGPPDTWGCSDCRNTGLGSPAHAVLECKWTGSWNGWGDPGGDDIPVYYRAQVQWQCDVMDVDEWHLAVLGPSGFRAYQGRRDETDLRMMREAGRRFMQQIENDDPPGVDEHAATLSTLKKLHPDLDDRAQEVDPATAAGYRRARALKTHATALCDRYEARLRAAMGDAKRAVCDGQTVATRVISDIAERTQTVAAHRRDYLLAPREKK